MSAAAGRIAVCAILLLSNLVLLPVTLRADLRSDDRNDLRSVITVWPVAPPLTHIPAMGLSVLDPSGPPPAPREGMAPLLRALLPRMPGEGATGAAGLALPPESAAWAGRAQALRYLIQQDAAALIGRIGPDRLAAFLAARPELSARYGEVAVWLDLEKRLGQP